MKKLVSRFMAVLMAMTMILSMSMTAFAAEAPKGNLTVNNTVAGKTLDLYQIFTATKSGENVAYTLNSEYEGFFKNNTRISGSESLTGEALSEAAYNYVKTQVGTNGDAETAKTFAKDMLGWILDSNNNITATTTVETTATSTQISDLTYGYYLVYPKGATDTSTAPGNQTYTSAASLVNVTGDTSINMKSNYPTVDKKIIPAQSGSGIKVGAIVDGSWEGNHHMELDDENDSEDTIAPRGAADEKKARDFAIGDTVTYQLTSKVPDMTGYNSYTFKFTDTLSKGLLSLVNDVLDMAKLESDTVVFSDESINLDQVCQEITESLSFQAEEKGLHVIGEHDDYSGIYVWSNAVHLKKILMNLFTNSMKYNKVNGFIYMSMRTIERSEDHMICEFKIKDNGIGMSEEFIKNELFTPFVQADNSPRSDYNGTGLGMPIVKQLVEKMGGTITVESKLGEGSCFTVILPFKIDTNARPEEKEDFDADISDIRVLLVEDNELNVEIAEFMLTENGAKVETVNNGLEAVQHFEASAPGTYDVILMDVMMPVMDGLTAARTIRALERQDAKTIPIIAMTANAFREDAERCMEAGMNAHLAKPLDDEKIKQTISEELRKQNACHE